MRKVFYFLLVVAAFVSCKEQDDTVEEFPNWIGYNDGYFSNLVADARAKRDAGDTSWELYPSYTKPAAGYTYATADYIVVQKLANEGASSGSWELGRLNPILTDTVRVHYVGQLLPSADKYKEKGMIFDRSYYGDFDPVVATPIKFSVGSVVSGFATAVMRMEPGDHWRVYIPYQLGYGTVARGSIPAGSTLIFDLRLVKFWRKK
jgi:FKBP-type peptidyl-prolyl cis-trans isomerase FklB